MAIAFVAFYHNFFTKKSSEMDAVNAMKAASGNPNFEIILAQHAKKIWLEELGRKIFPSK